ncbi:MAG: ABC transporter ATP-binding protein [Eubacteriales bacterium]|nr:ABC transporter ATP-binding protein [Eubacteriales bacterium]
MEKKLEVSYISKSFEDHMVLEDISIYLNEGEIVCLLGASGAGKTTLFHIIAGLLCPQNGTVKLSGEDITNAPGKISYMLQKDMLFPYKTVLDNVALPLMLQETGWHQWIGKKKRARAKAASYFGEFGIAGYETKYPAQMSGGMRQRAALLRTYLFSDEVALLDEPFSALDTITKSAMHQWYLQVMEQIRLSTLFVTHDIDEAILLSDRIYILAGNPGKIVKEIIIDKERPRSEEFLLSQEFLSYKRKILQYLK